MIDSQHLPSYSWEQGTTAGEGMAVCCEKGEKEKKTSASVDGEYVVKVKMLKSGEVSWWWWPLIPNYWGDNTE